MLCPLVPDLYGIQLQEATITKFKKRKKSFLNGPGFGFHPTLSRFHCQLQLKHRRLRFGDRLALCVY
jgi:hypothetical protein